MELTSGFHATEDIVDGEFPFLSFFELPACWLSRLLVFNFGFLLSVLVDFFPGHLNAANQAIEADREGRRADSAQIAANAPWTLNKQILSIEARLRPAHRMLRRL